MNSEDESQNEYSEIIIQQAREHLVDFEIATDLIVTGKLKGEF